MEDFVETHLLHAVRDTPIAPITSCVCESSVLTAVVTAEVRPAVHTAEVCSYTLPYPHGEHESVLLRL